MNISLSWLRSFVDTTRSNDEIAEILTRIGHEVDEIRHEGSPLEGVVVGKVLSVDPHPDADRLRVCQVDLGGGRVSQIVCGAANVEAGQYVPVATVGCVLPVTGKDGAPLTIAKAKIRGVESHGMICAEDELGLGNDHSGILVLDPWVGDDHVGLEFSTLMNVGPDAVLDIGLTPNRPDAASHLGLARDLACALGVPCHDPLGELEEAVVDAAPLREGPSIDLAAGAACPRYVGMVIRNVRVGSSPLWLRVRLRRIGLRPVNNVVDVTNYVLHEMGQPLHAFDLDTFTSGCVRVRTFDRETAFTTLDHVNRAIPSGSLFICDGDRPVALAGIMGGLDSEVSESTRTIFLESAYFSPAVIRRTSKRIGLQTDASYRFERGTDPMICAKAAWHAAHMIAELCGGEVVEGLSDMTGDLPAQPTVDLRPSRVERILGMPVRMERMTGILQGLGISCTVQTRSGAEVLSCRIPSFRPDISREIDLIEEIGRILDYNLLPVPGMVRAIVPAPIPARDLFLTRARDLVRSLRYQEIVTNSLLSREKAARYASDDSLLDTLNPVSQDATTLRTSLMPGALDVIAFNVNHGADRLRLFEIGHVYSRTSGPGDWFDGIRERTHLMMATAGDHDGGDWTGPLRSVSFEHLKADLTSLMRMLGLGSALATSARNDGAHTVPGADRIDWMHGDLWIGSLTAITTKGSMSRTGVDVPVIIAEIDLDACMAISEANPPLRYVEPSRFPLFEFDAAFLVAADQAVGELDEAIRGCIGDSLHSLEVFDLFDGGQLDAGTKSVAFRLRFLDHSKTLSGNDVEPMVKKMVEVLAHRFDAELRS